MLRGVLLALLLANLTFFVWSQAGLGTAGGTTAGQHEPERLLRQVHPEAVQLLRLPVAASTPAEGVSEASAAASTASGVEAVNAASSAASEEASAPASTEASASPAAQASAASGASAASTAVLALAPVSPPPPVPAPPGTRCLEAGPFNGVELASAETALAANAKTRRIPRRWVQMKPDAASAPSAPQHHLRVDATPSEVAVLESLPASVVGRSFTPCAAR